MHEHVVWALILILILVILVAFYINRRNILTYVTAGKIGGGKLLDNQQTRPYQHKHSSLEHAMHLKGLMIHDTIVKPQAHGGDPQSIQGGKISESEDKHWWQYDTWEELKKDITAVTQYFKDKEHVLDSLDLDWSAVLSTVLPKLQENREYIGHINADPRDKNKMVVTAMESSPMQLNNHMYSAGIPFDLAEKYVDKPALFLFHTHIDEENSVPLPSSPDISMAISTGCHNMFASNILISKYGVILYTPSLNAVQKKQSSESPGIEISQYRHDVIAALESVRSWRRWKLSDLEHLYNLFEFVFVVYPSSKFTADYHLIEFEPSPHADEEFMESLRFDIKTARAEKQN